jgi:hypothetical protein
MLNMSQSPANQADAGHHAASIERWDDEGGASRRSSATGIGESAGTLATWFVPPIVVPPLLASLVVVSVVYQQFW